MPTALLQPEKDGSNPKIDFKGNSGAKTGLNRKGSNASKARVKQKRRH
ncbi:MAG: hypothetical protein WCC04_11730 [Terriglobales bacterium]